MATSRSSSDKQQNLGGMIAELEVGANQLRSRRPREPDLILNDAGHSPIDETTPTASRSTSSPCTLSTARNIRRATAITKGKAATDAFNGKIRKYGGAPEREGMEFLPFALDTFELLHPKSHELLKRLARRNAETNAETVTNIRGNESVPAHAGRTYDRWLRTLSITRARAVGAFITGDISEANPYARAEALTNVLDAL